MQEESVDSNVVSLVNTYVYEVETNWGLLFKLHEALLDMVATKKLNYVTSAINWKLKKSPRKLE